MTNEVDMSKNVDEQTKRVAGLLSDFQVEFMGAFLPGVLFLIFLSISILPLMVAILSALSEKPQAFELSSVIRFSLSCITNTPYMFWLGVFIIFFTIAYFLGHLFYRQNPKEPDQRSLKYLNKTFNYEKNVKEDMCKRCEKRNGGCEINEAVPCQITLETKKEGREEAWRRINYGCASIDDCDFPYPYMNDYLEWRGHDHLIPFVKWATNSKNLSKTYINMLKMRIQYYLPDKFKPLLRIEAHVRLSTSTWFVAKVLLKVNLIVGLSLFAVLLIIFATRSIPAAASKNMFCLGYSVAALFPIAAVSLLAMYIKNVTQRFIHYQRIREVFHVLELAYTAFIKFPDIFNQPVFSQEKIFNRTKVIQ